MSDRPDPDHPDAGVLAAVPGLVRIAAGAWWRTTGWTVGVSIRAGDRVVRAAVSGEPVAEVLADLRAGVRDFARDALGLGGARDDDELVFDADGVMVEPDSPASAPEATATARVPAGARDDRPSPAALRERGAELLRRSSDVYAEDPVHPAYARILNELAPDEGRILRLLVQEGPQPSVDVRTGIPLTANSQVVAPGLSMIGSQAGCRYLDRVPAYLNNLFRLGLIWFSREQLQDRLRYQVLEAQPEVVAALKEGGRGRTVRRSIVLTPFGGDFCETCLPLHTGELEELPGDGRPAPGER